MTREERLKALFDELEKDAYNAEYHNYYYKEANQIIRKHFELSLPPAEGAEAIVKKYEDEYDFKFHWVQRDRVIRMMREFAAQQQPTAEGAEEILEKTTLSDTSVPNVPLTWLINPKSPTWNAVVAAMQEFATLHAQRIAEKMVEENLVEFGNMIKDEPNGDIAALAEYFIRTINLKSREP